jgi:ADP-heptose:LPS heptosyltransferase
VTGHTEYRRILIVKPSSLGDVIHARLTLAVLRRGFSIAHIAWLVKRECAERRSLLPGAGSSGKRDCVMHASTAP